MTKTALVCGAGGFIGSHVVRRLKREGFWVRGAGLKFPELAEPEAGDFVVADLRDNGNCKVVNDRHIPGSLAMRGRNALIRSKLSRAAFREPC